MPPERRGPTTTDDFVTMQNTLPKELEGFVTSRVAAGACASVDEFLRQLLRKRRRRP